MTRGSGNGLFRLRRYRVFLFRLVNDSSFRFGSHSVFLRKFSIHRGTFAVNLFGIAVSDVANSGMVGHLHDITDEDTVILAFDCSDNSQQPANTHGENSFQLLTRNTIIAVGDSSLSSLSVASVLALVFDLVLVAAPAMTPYSSLASSS